MKKLTEAQQHNLEAIKNAGGSMRRIRFRFCGADGKPILGMNSVAVASLVKLGLVTRTGSADEIGETFTIAPDSRRYMVLFLDYTDLPRAYGIAPDRATAERVAREQLAIYCEKQSRLGEPALARPESYTMQIQRVQ